MFKEYIIYSQKLKNISKLLKDLINDKILFNGDDNYYKLIDEVSTCLVKDEDSCSKSPNLCAVTENGKCKLILRKRSLIAYDKIEKNQQLMNDNKRLDSSIYENQLLIVQKSNEIAGLTDRDLGLQKDVKTLENKINNLKSNYEKANNHADNFSSDQLSRYFTDSLR